MRIVYALSLIAAPILVLGTGCTTTAEQEADQPGEWQAQEGPTPPPDTALFDFETGSGIGASGPGKGEYGPTGVTETQLDTVRVQEQTGQQDTVRGRDNQPR